MHDKSFATNSISSPSANDDLAKVSEIVERYETSCADGSAPAVTDFFPDPQSSYYVDVVCELLRIRVEQDWARGEQHALDQILQELPEILDRPEILGPVAFEDFRQAHSAGVARTPQWYSQRWNINTATWSDDWTQSVTGSDLASANHGSSWLSTRSPQRLRRQAETQAVRADLTAHNQLNLHLPSATKPVGLAFPLAGTRLGEFELLRELGQGAFSRVYLARQRDLANRQVVLKVTAMPLGESQRLARLQHANIMPLYSIHQVQHWFLLCMPWLGSITLKNVIEALHREHLPKPVATSRRQSPAVVLDRVLDDHEQSSTARDWPAQTAASSSAAKPLAGLRAQWQSSSLSDAILMIALQTARGLDHAHQRGILHRDIKPANVLLSFDGEPILLDFNLSRDAGHPQDHRAKAMGGTLPYMAPEQLRAMWLESGPVEQTADIYSLGAVLFELFTGRLPYDLIPLSLEQLSPALEQRKIAVTLEHGPIGITPAVAAIIQRCLAYEPSQRYQSANQLATDLELQLANQPLRFAGNPSWSERWRKYLKRHPALKQTTTIIAIAMLLVAMLTAGLWQLTTALRRQHALETWQEFQQAAHLAEAALLFPDGGSYELGRARAQQALALFSAEQPNWQTNSQVAALPDRSRQELTARIQSLRQLVEDVTKSPEELVSWPEPVNQQDLFNVASQAFLRREYPSAIDQLLLALESQPQRFALWFLLAKCHYEQREYRQADHAFAMAHQLDRQSALSLLGRAMCDYWMRDDESAWNHLEQAAKLDPDLPAIYVNRSLIRERQQRWPEAIAEIDRALALAPDTARYLMIRSRVQRKQGQRTLADQDLQRVREVQPRDPEDWIMRGLALATDQPEAALVDFQAAAQFPSQSLVARQNMAHILSERLNRPDEALQVLTEMLDEYPQFALGRAGRAVLYARQNRSAEALADIEELKKGPLTPQLHYQIGCALALLAVQDGSLANQALHHLAVAVEPAYGGEVIGTDRDLKSLETNSAFQRIKTAIGEIKRWQATPQ